MTILSILIYSLLVLISWFILYFVINNAVRNGIREARSDHDGSAFSGVKQSDKPANFPQTRLH